MDPILLAAAGFDPTGAAGLLLDIRVFNAHGWTGMGLVTAVTAQNTLEVFEIQCTCPQSLKKQYVALRKDAAVSGIKIGMLGCAEHLEVLEYIIDGLPHIPVVVDTVFRSGSGTPLFPEDKVGKFLKSFKGRAAVITPNLNEASMLAGYTVDSPASMKEAAEIIHGKTGAACLLKGGHLLKKKIDILYDGEKLHSFPHPSINKQVRGTGCYLSSTLLCLLSQGQPLLSAVDRSISLTLEAMERAVKVRGDRHIMEWRSRTSGLTRPQTQADAGEE